MPTEVLSVNRGTQCGLESTHGTGVAASKRLKMLGLTMGPQLDFKIFQAMGRRAKSTAALNKNMTVAKLAGKANYTEIVYPFSMVMGGPTITTPGGATLARKWLWEPALTGSIDPKSLTFEVGETASRAQKFTYGFSPSVALSLNREGDCDLESVVWGQPFTDAITMTTTPTDIAQIPLIGKHNSYYVDNTSGGLGGTKLLRVWEGAKFGYADVYNLLWPQDRAQASFAAHADNDDVKPSIVITVEADAAGMGLYADAIANTTKYVRVESISDQIIEASTPYSLTIDMASRITQIGELKDGAGKTVALDVTFTAIEDTSWGKFLSIALITTLTAL